MNTSFFYEKTDHLKREIVPLSRIQCLAMVKTNLCDNKKMNCDENGCIYNKINLKKASLLGIKIKCSLILNANFTRKILLKIS